MTMKRVVVDGKTLNKRTADMLDRLEFNLLKDLYVVQGSYNSGGVSASAGTHDGGGAVDLSPSGMSQELKDKVVLEARKVGFAMWHRLPSQGPWSEHFHGIAIGDGELSSGAKSQVQQYYAGTNGLANHARDDGPRLKKIRVWPDVQMKKVNLLAVRKAFKNSNKRYSEDVARVQWVLNQKTSTNIAVDGLAGPKTVQAYKLWETYCDAKKPDGIPNPKTFSKLGIGYFKPGYIDWQKFKKKKNK